MICAIALGLLGLFALRRAHRRCRGHHGYGWHGHGHGHGWHGWHGSWGPPWQGYGRRGWMMHAALARLDATPAQERAIVAEVDRLTERVHAAKSGLKEGRGDLAAAVRGAALDDAAMGAALGRVDTATAELRRAAIDALRGIHAVLDDKQRAQLADLLDRGGGWWRGGPYR
jgi:Spy/CpxP family protein refolding chaperone